MKTKIDYLNTVLKSLRLVWQNKYLWILGFFSAGIIFLNNLSPQVRINIQRPYFLGSSLKEYFSNILDFFIGHPLRITIGISVLALIFLILIILGCLSQSALIYAVHKETGKKKQKLHFWTSIRASYKFFWRILGIDLTFALTILIVILVFLGPPVGLLVFQEKILISTMLAFFGGLISFILMIIAIFVLRYGAIIIVLEDKGIMPSIAAAYKLLVKNPVSTIIVHVLLAISSLILSCGYILIFLILLIPLVLVAIILWLILHYLTIPVMLILIIAASLTIAAVTAGLISAFESTAWTLTYKQLKSRGFKLN